MAHGDSDDQLIRIASAIKMQGRIQDFKGEGGGGEGLLDSLGVSVYNL